MTVGEKIASLRKRAGLTQEELAAKLDCGISKIQSIEKDETVPSTKYVRAIRKALGYGDNEPITNEEVQEFRQKMDLWSKTMKLKLYSKTDSIWEEFEKTKKLIDEPEVAFLYQLNIIHCMARNNRIAEAHQVLKEMDISDVCAELIYDYYIVNGIIYTYSELYEDALEEFSKSERLMPKFASTDTVLHKNCAICYSELDMIVQSISHVEIVHYLEKSPDYDIKNMIYFNNIIAMNYLGLGSYSICKKLLEDSLASAKVNKDILYIAVTLHNLGTFYLYQGQPEKALECFDEVPKYQDESHDPWRYYINLLFKVYALFSLGEDRKQEAEDLMEKGIASTDENTITGLLFRILKCSRNLNDEKSLEYMENFALPKVIEKGKKIKPIEYCELLENFYKERNCPEKVEKYIKLGRDLYKKILSL
ncbi:MAG: helix-turn-helix transcriptional regulator [Clostridiales bacterium]|jgi:pentatricopeptide repeat protein|nr:helix-turn-helix transcriptional regulator [Clostridiales bacterium]